MATWFVCPPDPPADIVAECDVQAEPDGLQSIIDAAAPGDEVEVAAGIWTGPLWIEKDLTLRGRYDPDAAVVITDGASPAESLITVRDATVSLSFLKILSVETRPVRAEAAQLSIEHSDFHSTAGAPRGGGLYAEDSTISCDGCSFWGNRALLGGAHVAAVDSDVTLWSGAFNAGETGGEGGAILVIGRNRTPTLHVELTGFEGNRARSGGAVAALDEGAAPRVTIVGATFTRNEAGFGGALWLTGSATIDGARFEGNRASSNGGVLMNVIEYGLDVDVMRSEICGNEAYAGGAVSLVSGGADEVTGTFANNRLVGNLATVGGALQVADESGVLVLHNAFVANEATFAGVAQLGGAVRFEHNLLVDNVAVGEANADSGAGVLVYASLPEAVNSEHNLWWGNDGTLIAGFTSDDDVHGDPLLAIHDLDLSYGRPACAGRSELVATWYGAARDAGSTGAEHADLDGSRADIGPQGGPLADPLWWSDADGDGYPVLYDCLEHSWDGDGIDHEPTDVHPDAEDEPYDGFDADCDAWSDDDADHDGFDALEQGGTDCDDARPDVFPGAPDLGGDGLDADCDQSDAEDFDRDGFAAPEDCDDADPSVHPGRPDDDPTVDRDCDGFADVRTPLRPRGCATAAASGSWWAFALLLWRRRSAGPRVAGRRAVT